MLSASIAAPTGKPVTPKRVAMTVLSAGAVAGSGSVGPPLLLELLELELLLLPVPLLEPPPPLLLPGLASLPPQAESVIARTAIAAETIFMKTPFSSAGTTF
jgi:hypothetical protein